MPLFLSLTGVWQLAFTASHWQRISEPMEEVAVVLCRMQRGLSSRDSGFRPAFSAQGLSRDLDKQQSNHCH